MSPEPTLSQLTPALYARMTPLEQRWADRYFGELLRGIVAGNPGFHAATVPAAAKRSYVLTNLRLIRLGRFIGTAAVISIVFAAVHQPLWIIPGVVVLAALAVQIVFCQRRGIQIGRYFREQFEVNP